MERIPGRQHIGAILNPDYESFLLQQILSFLFGKKTSQNMLFFFNSHSNCNAKASWKSLILLQHH